MLELTIVKLGTVRPGSELEESSSKPHLGFLRQPAWQQASRLRFKTLRADPAQQAAPAMLYLYTENFHKMKVNVEISNFEALMIFNLCTLTIFLKTFFSV